MFGLTGNNNLFVRIPNSYSPTDSSESTNLLRRMFIALNNQDIIWMA